MGNTKYSLSETAAARQLAELPEQADDLRTRLAVAERRAESAEQAVQDARSELARAVLGAARAEADAVAIRAQAADELEQHAERLRDELAAAQAAARASETELARLRARCGRARKQRSNGSHTFATGSLPVTNAVWRWRRDVAAGLLVLLAVGATGLLINLSLLFDGGGLTKDGPAVTSGIARPEDPAAQAVAKALAAIERETRRLRAAAKATALLRESLARRKGVATVAVSADRRRNESWLLYMPVEREAVRSYLLAPRALGPSIAQGVREDRARSAERRR